MIARATPWGTIQIGKDFALLSPLAQKAVLAHEQGHIHHRHALKRLCWILSMKAFFQTERFFQMCESQELEADRYAVAQGHVEGLISFLARHSHHVKCDGYPTIKQRLEAIRVR